MKLFYLIFCLLVINSCNDIKSNQIIGRYYLVAIDTEYNMSIGYEVDEAETTVDVVSETVFSVGNNDKYIIAKQHPYENKKITNYFIIPIYKEFTYFPEKGVIGPLSLNEFIIKQKELNISNLVFDKNIKNLE